MQKYNSNDPRAVEDRRQTVQLETDADLLALKEVLSSKAGRRLIWKYLSFCGLFKSSLNQSGSMTYFNEGMRNVGLKIFTDVTASSPDAFLLMMKENQRETV